MARCEVCGNDYDKAFEVTLMGRSHTFESFECAIHALAPDCVHCGVKIAGHGLEKDGRIFCCAIAPSRRARPNCAIAPEDAGPVQPEPRSRAPMQQVGRPIGVAAQAI